MLTSSFIAACLLQTALACPPCSGPAYISFEVTGESWILNQSWNINFDPGGWTVTSATGWARALAFGLGRYNTGNWECLDPEPEVPDPWDVVVTNVDGPADLLAGSVNAYANTLSSPWFNLGSWASIGGDAFNISSSSLQKVGKELWKEQMSCPDEEWCRTLSGRLNAFELVGAAGTMSRSYTFDPGPPPDMSYTLNKNYDFNFVTEQFSFCDDESAGSAAVTLLRVDFSQYMNTANLSGGGEITNVIAGLIGVRSDGSTIRMGFYDDPAFNTMNTPNGFSIDGSASATVTLSDPNIVSIEDSIFEDSYAGFDGNVDGDPEGEVCWTDRELMIALQGVAFGDVAYRPRADADLNGVIDADDIEELNTYGCSADVDCDGDLDTFDFVEFQNLFTMEDPSADMNADGSINILDFLEYQNVFILGCE